MKKYDDWGNTRILGLDYGTRRIGAAVSDPRRSIATPLEVYERRNIQRDAAHYQTLVKEHDVDRIVVGLPLHTGGGEGGLAKQARIFGLWLTEQTGIPVVYQDERYSTVDADEVLRSAGFKVKDRKAKRDMLAARILLQNYLDAGCPDDEAPALPLSDEPAGD